MLLARTIQFSIYGVQPVYPYNKPVKPIPYLQSKELFFNKMLTLQTMHNNLYLHSSIHHAVTNYRLFINTTKVTYL